MKNIKNLWSIICRSSSIDRDTNIISLFDLVEEITITSDLKSGSIKNSELIHIPIEIITMWQRSESIEKDLVINVKIVSVSPNGKENNIGPVALTFEKGKPRVRLRVKVGGVVFNGFGQYNFKVLFEEKNKYVEVEEIPLEVKASMKL